MDELVALCKRRGFIYQSAEIYGGLQGVYDYGPLGVELKNNLKSAWWQSMVPSGAIFLVVISLNFLGDWLRDRLDPRLRQVD